MNNKFRLEKVLHEVIRDLPKAKRIEDCFDMGVLTFEEALIMIADSVRYEKERNAK